jgi:hypothetical protein
MQKAASHDGDDEISVNYDCTANKYIKREHTSFGPA